MQCTCPPGFKGKRCEGKVTSPLCIRNSNDMVAIDTIAYCHTNVNPPYRTMLHDIIPYHTIPYHTIPYLNIFRVVMLTYTFS